MNALVLNDGSVCPLDIIVSDYNLDGMSSDSHNAKKIQEEKQRFYCQYHLKSIVLDYFSWEQWIYEHRVMVWAWNKRWIRVPLEFAYHFLRRIKQVKQGFCSIH